jgi:hypothetical protein
VLEEPPATSSNTSVVTNRDTSYVPSFVISRVYGKLGEKSTATVIPNSMTGISNSTSLIFSSNDPNL